MSKNRMFPSKVRDVLQRFVLAAAAGVAVIVALATVAPRLLKLSGFLCASLVVLLVVPVLRKEGS